MFVFWGDSSQAVKNLVNSMIGKIRRSILTKRVTSAGMAVIMSAVMLLSGGGGLLTYASTRDAYYEFDHAVYDAAYDLARAYDKTVSALKASGINLSKAQLTLSKTQYAYTGKECTPSVEVKAAGVTLIQDQDYRVDYRDNLNVGTASVLITPASASFVGSKTANFAIVKGKTSFKLKVSNKKIKVTSLSKGSSEVRFSVKKVTNGQKSKVKINSKTGKLTLKKNIRKCSIYVKATSKANKNRKAKTKTIKVVVR